MIKDMIKNGLYKKNITKLKATNYLRILSQFN